jgi:hypothetical protein
MGVAAGLAAQEFAEDPVSCFRASGEWKFIRISFSRTLGVSETNVFEAKEEIPGQARW